MEKTLSSAAPAQRKPTRQTARLLQALLAADMWHYGYDLAKETGLRTNSVYAILDRLNEAGLIKQSWDLEGPRPRHLVKLNDDGRAYASETLRLFVDRTTAARPRRPAKAS